MVSLMVFALISFNRFLGLDFIASLTYNRDLLIRLIPLMLIYILIPIILKMSAKKIREISIYNFTVKSPRAYNMEGLYLMIAYLYGIMAIIIWENSLPTSNLTMILFMCIFISIGSAIIFLRKLKVIDNQFRYVAFYGRSKSFLVTDIKRVAVDNKITLYSDTEKLAFVVELDLGYNLLLSRLSKKGHGVRV